MQGNGKKRLTIYRYKFPMTNMIIIYDEFVLIKINFKKYIVHLYNKKA